MQDNELHLDVSMGLKRVLGRELITDDEIAIFEMVKNSFDAGATNVHLYFDNEKIIVADDGSGMSYDDLTSKWLFVAYSAKRQRGFERDFRDKAAGRSHLAGSKGVGGFSSARLGESIILQTRIAEPGAPTRTLNINWADFEQDDTQHFESIPVACRAADDFVLPKELKAFHAKLTHGRRKTKSEAIVINRSTTISGWLCLQLRYSVVAMP